MGPHTPGFQFNDQGEVPMLIQFDWGESLGVQQAPIHASPKQDVDRFLKNGGILVTEVANPEVINI